MDERTRNIATTCFASGCATFLALCIAAPALGIEWALAIAAGVGAPIGYFGYRFKDVLRAILRAARATIPIVGIVLCAVCITAPLEIWRAFREFTSRPRPFFWTNLLCSAIAASALVFREMRLSSPPLIVAYVELLVLFIGSFVLSVFVPIALAMIAVCARESSCKRWMATCTAAGIPLNDPMMVGYSLPYSAMFRFYADALWNVVYGIGYAIFAICWLLPRAIFQFAHQLFRIIHSDERTICTVDGPLGGIITYAALRIHHGNELAALPTLTLFGLVLLGGAVAALIGIANFEIISIRVLKTLPARVRSE